MTEAVATPPAAPAAPAAPAVPAVPTPPAAPAASPAPPPAGLFSVTPAASPAPSGAPAASPAPAAQGNAPDWMPEKYRVLGADGQIDMAASAQKLAQGYDHASKRIGTGDLPPESADKYVLTKPEALKDMPLSEEAFGAFREKAHKAGYTQAQFDLAAAEFFEMVPNLLGEAASMKAEDCRTELQKVWTAPADFAANLQAGQRAVSSLPESLQRSIVESGLGTNPVIAQVLAAFGREMREDRPPSGAGGGQQYGNDAEALMKHPAYRDPKHAEHAAISARVVAINKQRYGEAPAT